MEKLGGEKMMMMMTLFSIIFLGCLLHFPLEDNVNRRVERQRPIVFS